MIAIAGAKGGCGKTTTALGLAQALGRAGNPTIAVDADRHLPNLHVTARVDREPTVERLNVDEDVFDLAQPLSDQPDVSVLPAPTETDSVSMHEQLRPLTTAEADIVLDCPSGAGPDLTDPLSAADAAVVVTTGTDESLTAAAKTIDVVRRLEVPVAGTVLTRSETVPTRYERRIDSPVLATIPAVEEPLRAASARDAFDTLASTLETKEYLPRSIPVHDRPENRIETGIDVLDRKLDGGLPPGSVVAYSADAASQSELLLYELAATRRTLYLATERSDTLVSHALESSQLVDDPTVRQVDGEDRLEEVTRLLDDLPDGSNLVIDTMDALERSETADYVAFLNELKERMLETDSVALLHCLKGPDDPYNRTRTEHSADVVFDLRTDSSGTELETQLSIPKLRCGGRPTETIKLELTERVEIDTSRDIA